MTEEEKKEFEEFLKWKAEKEKKQEANKQKIESEGEITSFNESSNPSLKSQIKSNSPDSNQENSGNKALLVFILFFIAILVLFFAFIGLNSNKNTESTLAVVEDSIETVFDDEAISEPIIDTAQDSIKREERINAVKKTIKITSAYLGRPNSASGVDAYFYYKNLSDKTIKYLVWEGYPMNSVGDRVGCDIRGYQDYRGKDTGPVKPGKSSGGCWGCAWYNSTAKKLVLTGIDIEYMDGSTFTITENEIEYIR